MIKQHWTPFRGQTTCLAAELNSLANGTNKLSAEIKNRYLDKYLAIELVLASVNLSTQVNPAVYVWIIPKTDAANYEDGGDSVTPARVVDAVIPLRAINGAQRVYCRKVEVPPNDFKILVGNYSGAAFAATGNTLKYDFYSEGEQ